MLWRDEAWKGEVDGFPIQSARKLGSGGDGTVYAASIQFGGRTGEYAVKVNNRQGVDSAFGEDAVKLANVKIPGAVIPQGPFEAKIEGETLPSMIVVMPRIEGVNLREKIAQDGPLSKRETVAMMAQVARTLNCGHEQGFVHMDVKPGNIMYEAPTKRFLTIDWGEVHTKGDELKFDVGTLGYQAPQQWQGGKADPKMDVYSLGLTAAEANTGFLHRRRLGNLGPLQIKEFIVAGKPGHPDLKDPYLNAVVKRATMLNPEDRGTALDVMTDLAAYAEARTAYDPKDREAVTNHLIARASDEKRRNPILDAAAAAGLLRDGDAKHPRRKALESISAMAPDISGLDLEAARQHQQQHQQVPNQVPAQVTGPRR